MSKVSEHLLATHKAAHVHHNEMIAAHSAALEKAAAVEPTGGPHTTFHKAGVATHTKMRDHHAAQIADCEKAVGDGLEKAMPLPIGLSTIAPTRPTVVAVPRHGQPQVPVGAATDLTKIIGIDDESMHAEELSLQK
ncbi:MAG TPA: hypothetical protein VKP61_15285 [Candidatus Acidoferrum sp.]|nr:hypothetical protein [Candidatus Acidoferrum sp.]